MSITDHEKTLWTAKQAAQQLSLSARTLERMIANKQIPFIKIGRLVLIPAEAAKLWVEEKLSPADNTYGARRDVHEHVGGIGKCQSALKMAYSNAKTRNSGGSVLFKAIHCPDSPWVFC